MGTMAWELRFGTHRIPGWPIALLLGVVLLVVGSTIYNWMTAEERAQEELTGHGYREIELGSVGLASACEGRFNFVGVEFSAVAPSEPAVRVVEPSVHSGAVCFPSVPPFDGQIRITDETPVITGESP